MTRCEVAFNGVLGFVGSFLGILTTYQEQLEWHVRMLGGVLGIAVGAITLYRLLTRKHG